MTYKIDVLIADDHPLLLEGLAVVLERNFPEFNIYKATNGLEALQSILEHHPQLAILDIEMPHLDGLEVAKKLKESHHHCKVIFLTLHKERIFFEETKNLDASGYVLKEFSTLEIVTAIKEVLAGRKFYGKGLELFSKETENNLPDFTKTETHIIQLIAQGKTSKEISEMLFISSKTVESHRYNISKKLDLPSEKNSLLKWAMQNSLKIKG
ncbi:MAG: response regulator transcription factor [Flavobacteriaceae bacterium]|nr:response regulator transcription factor [Flavobacteriaceae bacterium]